MTHDFIEIQFPVDISYGSSGGPEYYTDILHTISGCEIRSSKLHNPKMKFNISTGIKNKAQMEGVMGFFRCCRGRNIAFRYKDWSDFKGENEPVKIINSHTLQLIKVYSLDANTTYERIINKPVKNTVKIQINDNIISDTQLEIDYTTGRIILPQCQIDVENTRILANFEFDVPVRFNTDYLPVTIENYNFYSLPPIELIEVKI